MYATRDKKLGQMLVERGWITGEQLIRAIQSQRMVGGRLGTCLLEMDVLDEDTLLDALSDQLRVPSVRVEQMRAIAPETVALLPAKVASRCLAVPFFANRNEAHIATLSVRNLGFLDELTFCTERKVVPHIANEVRIYEALEKYYGYELPKRYGHLLDRLNRSRYLWDESAKILIGQADTDVAWSSPDEAFGSGRLPGPKIRGLVQAASGHSQKGLASPSPAAAPIDARSPIRPGLPRPTEGAPPAVHAPAAKEDRDTVPVGGLAVEAVAERMDQAGGQLEQRPIEQRVVHGGAVTAAAPLPALEPHPLRIAPVAEPAEAPPTPSPSPAITNLEEVDRLLGEASDPHQIADVMLRFAMSVFSRAALFSVRPENGGHRFRGWKIRGEGTDAALFTSFEVSSAEASMFAEIDAVTPWRLGALSPMPIHRKLASCWGGEFPKTCLLVPVAMRGRMACLLYGDRGSEGLAQVDPNEWRRLAMKAAMAFELCILRKKIQDV